ncbi:MAG: AAA family ATPase [Gemmatimonadaceae bacterium]|jgi:cellulose biosynthesis protein BcsQ|nr:AAA family ATPase [Gemmatimonadaceae bacterium]
MTHVPVLTFFNNKGGVGKTSLVFHVSSMLARLGHRVLVADLDPQANLTAAFLPEEALVQRWEPQSSTDRALTIFDAVSPLQDVGDVRPVDVANLGPGLALIPGDLRLATFEELLTTAWADVMSSGSRVRAFRILRSFWHVIQTSAHAHDAGIIVLDVGPSLGGINRTALLATDAVVVPLAADLFSLQGLRNLGPTLQRWRTEWSVRLATGEQPPFDVPHGAMRPIGYVLQQHAVRLDRPVIAYDRWARRMPGAFRQYMMPDAGGSVPPTAADDPFCLALLKHYRSLVPIAQEARKPIFDLTSADGAVGSHARSVSDAFRDFKELAGRILKQVPLASHELAG